MGASGGMDATARAVVLPCCACACRRGASTSPPAARFGCRVHVGCRSEPQEEGSGAATASHARRVGVPVSATQLTVLSGPSGVGKSSLIKELRRQRPDIWVSVSTTTRPPRSGEVEGHDYFFVDHATFAGLRDSGEFLESAEFAGNWYGTPRTPVLAHLAAGTPVILEIDLEGARQVRQAMPQARLVFLAPPRWEDLVARLSGRGTESPDVVARRLAAARVELAAEEEFDVTLVNDQLEHALQGLISLLGLPPQPPS